MGNLKVGTRLVFSFLFVTAVMSAAAVVGILAIRDINHVVQDFTSRGVPNLTAALRWQIALQETARNMRTLLLVHDPEVIRNIQKQIADGQAKRGQYFEALDKRVTLPEAKAILARIADARTRLLPMEAEYQRLLADRKPDEAQSYLIDKLRLVQLELGKGIEDLIAVEEKLVATESAAATAAASSGVNLMSGAMAAAIAAALLLAWLVTRSLVRPLNEAVRISAEITRGNLKNAVPPARGDEIGALMASLGSMQNSLADLVRQIQSNAGEVSSAAAQLVSTAQQVTASSDSQSEAASAMAASVEQMTVSINHIAESAQLANTKTSESSDLSTSSRGVVDRAGSEMDAIASSIEESASLVKALQEQSREISSIAKAIDAIAEQTNLLALNAAIEAARAGEQGRGFAVVADAVRELAERTTQSTSEISTTITRIQERTDMVFANMNDSVGRVREGVTLSREAGASIHKVNAVAREVMASVSEISTALKEQSAASTAIAQHVEKIAQMAEENTAAVGHAHDSARHLEGLAGKLQSSVMRFAV